MIWHALRAGRLMSHKFKRQVTIDDFIVNFMCFEQKLMIEIDGGQHLENVTDIMRDVKLNSLGFTVLRFWNNEIMENLEGVLMVILQNLQAATPLPSPLPLGARECSASIGGADSSSLQHSLAIG